MQHQWHLGTEGADKLILFFNGWAMTPESALHLQLPQGYDLLVAWDYRDDALSVDLSRYRAITLVAWSMGVWAVERQQAWLRTLPLERAIAICGTGLPMHDAWGIPVATFEGTIQGLSPENRKRFNRRMCGGRTYTHLLEALEQRSTEEIRDELERVRQLELERTEPQPQRGLWTKAYIGGEDRIFPPANQQSYWSEAGVPTEYQADRAHYLMGTLEHWEELW